MYVVLIAVIIGIAIGYFTNSLAIKMLFRPLKPWMIGRWKVPFTPGLIPKRKEELAESFGDLVENHLFTAQGLKQFIEQSEMKEQIYLNLINKNEYLRNKNLSVDYILSTYINEDWKKELRIDGEIKVLNFLYNEDFRAKSLNDLLSENAIKSIEDNINKLSPIIIEEIKKYLHSSEGKGMLNNLISKLFEGKKMLGFFAGMFMDGNQFEDKILDYINQLLDDAKTKEAINKIIYKKWELIKVEPIDNYLGKIDHIIINESKFLLAKGIEKFADMPLNNILILLEKKNFYGKIFNLTVNILLDKIEKVFSFLSISKVVKDEVNKYSLEKLESIILEISGKELKVITYLGGFIGGVIGLLQGILYLFL